ncbi:MAG: hypothetical protein WEB88_13020 [Gemmatimonadota bacterium]
MSLLGKQRFKLGAALMALLLAVPAPALAQGGQNQVINAPTSPLLQGFQWREIGPIQQGGRVDDIEVNPADPYTYYVGFSTAGVWKTSNNGITFENVFDEYETASIGDMAIAPSNPNVVYVGTGEANNRQSSSYGYGVYKTTDGGESFQHMGLEGTQTIARIRVHPTNPDVVWVAANGALFGPSPERGVYKSSNGGRTWDRTLYVDENTGATELIIDPSNPNNLYAATYQRRRTSCCFVGGGPGSGIWRSTDGGEHWTRLSGNGLPGGTMGRVALDWSLSNPNVIYAQIEVAADRSPPMTEAEWEAERERREEAEDAGQDVTDPNADGVWRSTDGGQNWEFRSNHNVRPMYFSQLRVHTQNPEIVYTGGVQAYKSTDGGRTFQTMRGLGHVDHHAIWVDPTDGDHVMYGNDGSVDVTYDGGEAWESLRGWSVGQPYHASVDMRRPYYVCTGLQDNGSWCGPSSVRSGGILPQDWYRVGGGDGFYTAVDPTDYTIIYSESQNGNVRRIHLDGDGGGSIRPRTPSNNGENLGNIVPTPSANTRIQWNWSTPFMLSPHDPRTIHVGGNHLFTSHDRGETYRMSPELTKGVDIRALDIMGTPYDLGRCGRTPPGQPCILSRNDGVNVWGTSVSVSESAVIPGLLWVGTDDGNIQVSRNGGETFTEVGQNIPGGTMEYYVSRVEASHFDPTMAFASLDGALDNDMRPYVFVTHDYGQSWTNITSNLPAFGNVNTVRQDARNPNLLYVGTENGFFVSLNQGQSWEQFMPGLATGRVDDVLVHPRDNDLVLATHSYSVQIMDDITSLQQMTPAVLASDVHLFQPREAVLWRSDPRYSRPVTGNKGWVGRGAPDGAFLSFYLGSAPRGQATLTIREAGSPDVIRTIEVQTTTGLNRVQWDLREDPEEEEEQSGRRGPQRGPEVDAGSYVVTLSVNGQEQSRSVAVIEDVWMDQR